MDIAIIIAWNFKQLDGSTLRFFFTLQELIKRDHQITVLHDDCEAASYTASTFKCKTCHVNVSISRWDSIPVKIIKYILFVIRARRMLRQSHFDCVYSISLLNNLVAINVPAKKRIILYVDFMSNYYRYRNPGICSRPLYALARYLEHYTIKKADGVVVITHAMKQLISSQYHHKIYVIPDGADTQLFKPGLNTKEITARYQLPSDAAIVGYQGGIEPHDGLQFLVQAAPFIIEKFPNIRFVIAGKGSYLKKIKKMILDMKLTRYWVFTGWIESTAIPYLIAASDVTIVPVPNDPCTSPLITFRLLESMAAGALIVANDLPGMREIADDSMVLFTTVEDPKIFASSVIRALLLSDTEKKIRSERCRKKVETIDWRNIARQEVELICHESH